MAEKHVKFSEIQDIFDSFLLLKDRDLVRLTLAVIIGNQLPNRRPIWLMLVAPPSSGKTTTLNALLGLEVHTQAGERINPVHSISDMTENSFASGMQRSDAETSLLFKIPNGGVMVFKDFTSILSKRAEAKTIIMGQLREVYDGTYVKRTGTGKDIAWTGKIGAIAGVTQAVYQHLESMSVMGDRFMLYQIPQPDRKEMLKFKLRQEEQGTTEDVQMPLARELVHKYMQQAFDALQTVKVTLDAQTQDEIIDVADFCTMVRSGIIMNDYTGEIVFVPEPEMPARMFEQMLAIAATLILMRKIDNPDEELGSTLEAADFKLMYKIAYDSIPVVRRIALTYLAKYKGGVDTAALARKINYPTKVVGSWLEQLNALGVVDRLKTAGGQNSWKLKSEYQQLMERLQGVHAVDEAMTDASVDDDEQAAIAWESDKSGAIDPDEMDERINNGEW